MNKTSLFLMLLILPVLAVSGQQPKNSKARTPGNQFQAEKKYPSLLWEITGKGTQRPSYLFGTMHVSDKLAFHLGDSFYNALKSVQVVALETNPEYWQDNYSKSKFFGKRNQMEFGPRILDNYASPESNMKITSFAMDEYDEALKAALAVEPSLVNGFLYRSYGSQLADFEEDTYLDLYIFQAGKKLGKKLTGGEDFEQSEKLVLEAYRDMARDRNRKKKSYDVEGMFSNPKKLEDAYRKGDLDMLDSLDAMTITSEAFHEKFMYKRNEIQAKSIDSIIRKSPLFVAVGAAHLPGNRGVIELLRQMGYKLRPVKMDDRNSMQKELIEKMRSNIAFVKQVAKDSFYQVSIPGKKFYNFTEWSGMDLVQYADMVNGAYYMVTRVKTNSLFQGHSVERINKRIDSLLYENIPGKILKKSVITRNGYKGWEIINRTRRGDYQRYNILTTPFEIIVFKMSGNGDYITGGNEADQFFNSIRLKEYKPNGWRIYQPPTGGFSVLFPHEPSVLKDDNFGADRLEYGAFDNRNGNNYLIMKSSFHNYSYIEEDTFELNLMNESYRYSSFIQKQHARQFLKIGNYPALEATYKHKDGSFSKVRYIIQGPVYYLVIAHYMNESDEVNKFFSSFSITPNIYPETRPRVDTSMRFTVESPFFPNDSSNENNKDEIMSFFHVFANEEDEDDESMQSVFNNTRFKVIGNDTVGEKIWITSHRPGSYEFIKDTTRFWEKSMSEDAFTLMEDSSFIYKLNTQYSQPNGVRIRDLQLMDTGSSRMILVKYLYKDGHMFSLVALTDTLNSSPFLEKFFKTFRPADTLKGSSLFTKKTDLFFKDYFSADSATAKKARRSLPGMQFDSTDVPLIKQAIEKVNWKTWNYLEAKNQFIQELGYLKDPSITPFLRNLYIKVKDSSDLQNTILNALLQQKTSESFLTFKDLILQEPPIKTDDGYDYFTQNIQAIILRNIRFSSPGHMSEQLERYATWSPLYDTLALTRSIFPDILQLMNVDDYKEEIIDLLRTMVDSSQINASVYESLFSKLYVDGKQLLKKQVAEEERNNIEKTGRKDKKPYYFEEESDEELEQGNDELLKYAVLLLPFYEKNPGIPAYFEQLLKTKDRQLLYDAFLLMVRNKRKVPDSLFTYFAKQDRYRSRLYADLKEIKELDKFPINWKNQLEIARSLLMNDASNYTRPDSVVFLEKLPVVYKEKKGWVYFFKYKEARDDTFWQLASVGMQPDKEGEIEIENDDFTQQNGRKLKTDTPVREQLEDMLKEILYSKRPSASEFYNARMMNLYKSYLSEMVKSRRYRD